MSNRKEKIHVEDPDPALGGTRDLVEDPAVKDVIGDDTPQVPPVHPRGVTQEDINVGLVLDIVPETAFHVIVNMIAREIEKVASGAVIEDLNMILDAIFALIETVVIMGKKEQTRDVRLPQMTDAIVDVPRLVIVLNALKFPSEHQKITELIDRREMSIATTIRPIEQDEIVRRKGP